VRRRGFYINLPNSDHLMTKFNSLVGSRKVIVLDDQDANTDLKKKIGLVRNFTTRRFTPIERKGVDPVMSQERSLVIVFTNQPIHEVITQDDLRERRVLALEMSEAKVQDESFWTSFTDLTSSDEFKVNWFKYLMSIDLSGYNRKSPTLPVTDTLLQNVQRCRPAFATYIHRRFLQSGTPPTIWHCLDERCSTSLHNEGVPCATSNRLPIGVTLNIKTPTKVPRKSFFADYQTIMKAEWDVSKFGQDFKTLFCEPSSYKNPTVQFNVHEVAKEMTVSIINKKNKHETGSVQRSRESVVVKRITKENKTVFEIKSLKDIWDVMVTKGYVIPGEDVYPFEEDEESKMDVCTNMVEGFTGNQ
jgi:hypothetical protein